MIMGYSPYSPRGLVHRDAGRSFPGYTIFATMSGDCVYLLNGAGETVRTWQPPASLKPFGAEIRENGNLFLHCTDGSERWPFGGASAALIELDWDGNLVWQYRDPVLHHDSCWLRNGNLLVVGWEVLGPDVEKRVQGGVPGAGYPDGTIIGDFLREVDLEGKTVWEWHTSEHLDPAVETICPLDGRREWTHCNSAEELPDGNLLLSFRQTSAVLVIDKSSGRTVWRIQPGITCHQHAPSLLDNGCYLVFDNGEHRIGGGSYSRVVEIDPKAQQVTWEYRGAPRDSFFSTGISNAQRLPNGNTLICEGRPGRLFEVTPNCEIVWDYLNPYHFPHREELVQQAIYRAYRYAADSPQIRNRIQERR
jgi:outer membrane protein assembly factor BamB